MRLVSVEPHWGSLWGEEVETVKTAPVSVEAGMQRTPWPSVHHLAQDRDQCRAPVNTIMDLRVP
jgi:hypothetical protein